MIGFLFTVVLILGSIAVHFQWYLEPTFWLAMIFGALLGLAGSKS